MHGYWTEHMCRGRKLHQRRLLYIGNTAGLFDRRPTDPILYPARDTKHLPCRKSMRGIWLLRRRRGRDLFRWHRTSSDLCGHRTVNLFSASPMHQRSMLQPTDMPGRRSRDGSLSRHWAIDLHRRSNLRQRGLLHCYPNVSRGRHSDRRMHASEHLPGRNRTVHKWNLLWNAGDYHLPRQFACSCVLRFALDLSDG